MQQNTIRINSLKRMNKVKLFMLVTVIAGLHTNCCEEDCDLRSEMITLRETEAFATKT